MALAHFDVPMVKLCAIVVEKSLKKLVVGDLRVERLVAVVVFGGGVEALCVDDHGVIGLRGCHTPCVILGAAMEMERKGLKGRRSSVVKVGRILGVWWMDQHGLDPGVGWRSRQY